MGKSLRLPIVLVGARVFCLGMLALLTLPCDSSVGAVTFAFSGFKEDSLHLVSNSSWIFNTTTGCFHCNAADFDIFIGTSGRILYPGAVQMIDPGSTTVKSFSTSFIYHFPRMFGVGPGMAFIIAPDKVTLGAPGDFMGLITSEISANGKNYESDDHTLGVELDGYMNPEFNDTSNNHIGINLASMNSTYSFEPVYSLGSTSAILYQQIWIDYDEIDSRMDIYCANYKQGKPAKPQGSQSELDLSLLKENMFTGFSTANKIGTIDVPYVCAWSFSNDGIPAPSIVIAQDATPGAPPAPDAPVAAPSLPPPASTPSPPPAPISSTPPASMPSPPPEPIPSPPPALIPSPAPASIPSPAPSVPTRSPAPGISSPPPPPASDPAPLRAPNPSPFNPPNPPPPLSVPPQGPNSEPPTNTKREEKKKDLGIPVGVSLSLLLFVGLCIFVFCCWLKFLRRPLRIFISHAGGPDGSGKIFPRSLHEKMIEYKWSFSTLSNITFFLDKENLNYGLDFPEEIFAELAQSDVGLVVVTDDFFRRRWPMRELLYWKNALENDTARKLRVLPLFYRLTAKEVNGHLKDGTWEDAWKEMGEGDHPLEVKKCRDAVKWLCRKTGIVYCYNDLSHDKEYIDEICKRLDEILRQERSFSSYLRRAITCFLCSKRL